MNEIQRKIIDKIEKNHVSTTEILDILDKDWTFFIDIKPLVPKSYSVGLAHIVHIIDKSNWWLHLDLIDVPEDSIVLVRCHGERRAAFGSLVSKYLLLYKGVKAIICDKNLRDGHTLIKESYPVWCDNLVSVGCFNKHSEDGEKQYQEYKKWIFDNPILVCDDCGIAVITEEFQNEKFLLQLDWIEKQEDIWFSEVDNGKDTFEVVCKNTYLEDVEWMKKINFTIPKP